jgi:hypothetical protein
MNARHGLHPASPSGPGWLRSPFHRVCRTTLRYGLCGGFLAALAVGCAGPQTSPTARQSASTPLKIDTLTTAAILSTGELSRIAKKTPAQFRGDVIAAEALGRVVYAHEHLATLATRLVAPDGHASFGYAPAGWITERTAEGLKVVFVVKVDGSPRIAAEVLQKQQNAKPQVSRLSVPRALTPQETVLWRARQLAFTAAITPCSPQYNPVVVPVEARGKNLLYVFLLPIDSDPDVMFFGGYYRIAISADGTQILETHAFTHACIRLRRNSKALGAGVTEVISDSPTAPQVYASLAYGIAVDVVTTDSGLLWKIEDGVISYAGPANQD